MGCWTGHRIAFLPTTRAGRRAVALGAASVVLVLAWTVVPAGAALGFLCGLAGGAFALVAILRRGERAALVFVAVLPLLFVVGFVLAELLVGHD